MTRKAKAPLVIVGVFQVGSVGGPKAQEFERQWKADKTVTVRRFWRMVRVDGVGIEMVAFVVRRKAGVQ